MTLMGLTAAELRERIESELATNPALELASEKRCPSCRRLVGESGPCPVCSRQREAGSDEPIVFISQREDFYTAGGSYASFEDAAEDEYAAVEEDLPTYVMRQIAPDLAMEDRPLAAHILTGLDEDGLLRTPLVEIARYHHVSMERLNKVLRLIQRADPAGVGSPSPQEALLVQLELLAESGEAPILAAQAIRDAMDLLSRRQYGELARLLGISAKQARQIARFISDNLYPFPARAHWGSVYIPTEKNRDTYRIPDIVISCLNESAQSAFIIEVISPLAGKLRINPLFREALHQAPPEKAEQWEADLEHANLLIKCLQQRNHTMTRLVHRLATLQRAFILKGDAYLAPVTRASLAGELNVHESTISRAVSSKAVQLPSGKIIPLSKLFDRSLHIRTELRQIIAQESRPLTDTQLAGMLKTKGFDVARRTVAKYRAMEGILPAHLRQTAHVMV
jgi:RNA polymerase sigma-54 factor